MIKKLPLKPKRIYRSDFIKAKLTKAGGACDIKKQKCSSRLYQVHKNINLTFQCNNCCVFCYDEDKRETAVAIEFKRAVSIVEKVKSKGIDTVRLRGSEPTIYPYLNELTDFISSQGMKFNFASNARFFSDKEFTKRMIKKGLVSVYTSLHGHSDKLHDSITNSKESFKQTVEGIKNLLRYGVTVETNTTIVKSNVKYLKNIAEFLSKNFELFTHRFSFLWCKGAVLKNINIIPSLSEIKPYLSSAMNYLSNTGIYTFIEKAPVCILPEYKDYFKSEPYIVKENMKLKICSLCRYYNDDYCVGISHIYLILHGVSGINPIEK